MTGNGVAGEEGGKERRLGIAKSEGKMERRGRENRKEMQGRKKGLYVCMYVLLEVITIVNYSRKRAVLTFEE